MYTINALCDIAGITRTEFAEKVGVSRTAIMNYEKGVNSPTVRVAWNIINVLSEHGVDINIEKMFPNPKKK